MGTARHSPPGEERVTCGMCKKEIQKSEATSSEATDYVSYFCGKHCYDLWRRPHEKFDDQIKPPSTGTKRTTRTTRPNKHEKPNSNTHPTKTTNTTTNTTSRLSARLLRASATTLT